MSLENNGSNNIVEIAENCRKIQSSIYIKGNNNTVTVSSLSVLNKLSILIEGDGHSVHIGEKARVTGRFILKGTTSNGIIIGNGTSIGGANIIAGEGTFVRIGADCMLSWGIEIRSTDSHGIYNIASGDRINDAQDIIIDEHVWIGAHATILGGAHISSGSVVGIRSVITRVFDEKNIIIAGVPGRKVREGIRWERPLLG